MGSNDADGIRAELLRLEIRAELLRLETALAARDPSGADVPLADLIADDFVEFGASGQVWDAASVREWLEDAAAEALSVEAFDVSLVADDVALVTYRVTSSGRSNRVSVWVRRDGRWVVRFHQGTRTS